MARPARQHETSTLTPNTGDLTAGAQARRRRPAGGVKAESDWEPFSSYLPADLKRQFKVICVEQNLEMRDALSTAVQQWVNRRQH